MPDVVKQKVSVENAIMVIAAYSVVDTRAVGLGRGDDYFGTPIPGRQQIDRSQMNSAAIRRNTFVEISNKHLSCKGASKL